MFLQTKTKPDSLYVVLRSEMLKELLSVAPKFEEYVDVSNGKKGAVL